MESEDTFTKEFEAQRKEAIKRQEKRNILKTAITSCVNEVTAAEQVAKENGHSFNYQHTIAQAKAELLSILASLENEGADPSEILYLSGS